MMLFFPVGIFIVISTNMISTGILKGTIYFKRRAAEKTEIWDKLRPFAIQLLTHGSII